MSALNDIHAALTTVLENAGYSVHRQGYPYDIDAPTPYIVLAPRSGGIQRFFVNGAAQMNVVERHRIELTVWTRGTDATQAHDLYDDIADLIEYTTLAVTGATPIRREDLPIEINSSPFVRVTGTYIVDCNRTMAVGT